MNKVFILLLAHLCCGLAHADTDLSNAIKNVRINCNNINEELNNMKKLAGINTAITAVGTVTGGGATAVGITKTFTDKEAAEIEQELKKLQQLAHTQDIMNLKPIHISWADIDTTDTFAEQNQKNDITEKEKQLAQLKDKSKKLGNWRTGLMATSTVTNIAGTAIAGINHVQGDLKSQIDACLDSIKHLSSVRIQAQLNGDTNDTDLTRADNIIHACEEWNTVDIHSINKKASGATISGGIGAGLGLAGTITSAIANTNNNNNKTTNKNLNTASNVLAGGTTIASATATVFNATQISAIKRAASVAAKCSEALK